MSGDKKLSLDDKMKTLQNHFAAIVSTEKHLKSTVDDLKKKSIKINSEVQEIVETQRVVDKIVVAFSDAIKHMKQEISRMSRKKNTNEEDSNTIVGEDLNPIREIVVRQQSSDKTIVENSDAIKLLDEEIKMIVRDKSKKDLKKKEVDEGIKRLNMEMEQIRKVERESAEKVKR
jgi:hypothetical protein